MGKNMNSQLTLFQEDSRVNLSHLAGRAQWTYLSGKKCFELYERLNPGSSLPKMCLDLLLGRKGVHSKLCILTWKAKALPCSHRLLFQLAVRERRTEGTEFGLLPTPTVMNANTNLEALDKRRVKAIAKHINGNGIGLTLSELLARQMLPTPTHHDYRSGFNPEGTAFNDRQKHSRGVNIHEHIQRMTRPNFLLSHQYHLEMMGFPVDWCNIPKESLKELGKDRSKSPVIQSAPKSPTKSLKPSKQL